MARNPLAADLALFPARLKALLVAVFLTGVTTFMLMPFLAVSLTRSGLSIGQAGTCVAVLLFGQQGLGHVVGILVDRYGTQRILTVGLLLRVAAFVGLMSVNGFGALLVVCALIGAGGCLVTLPIRVEFIQQDPAIRQRSLALRGAAVNGAAILGPPLGTVLLAADFRWVCVAAMSTQIAVLTLLSRRSLRTGEHAGQRHGGLPSTDRDAGQDPRPSVVALLRDRRTVTLLLVAFTFWFSYSQLNTTVALATITATGSEAILSALFVANAAIVLTLEYPVIRGLSARRPSSYLLRLGMIAMSLAFAVLAAGVSIWVLAIFIVAFSAAEIFYSSSVDDVIGRIAPAQGGGRYIGVFSLGDAAGSVAGSAAGSALFALADTGGFTHAYWLAVAALVGAATVLFVIGEQRRPHLSKVEVQV
ncbi:MFS transporter [Micromonospora sp. NPDC047074]|uniref:MFS transporter n=1 Tax=Micromonospora sp. NPDC047074 TaxID=3154339 RepID=UPI0033ED07E2